MVSNNVDKLTRWKLLAMWPGNSVMDGRQTKIVKGKVLPLF